MAENLRKSEYYECIYVLLLEKPGFSSFSYYF